MRSGAKKIAPHEPQLLAVGHGRRFNRRHSSLQPPCVPLQPPPPAIILPETRLPVGPDPTGQPGLQRPALPPPAVPLGLSPRLLDATCCLHLLYWVLYSFTSPVSPLRPYV